MSGGRTTRVQVFYPTAEPVDCAMRYRIDYLAGFYELQSPLCARPNALALPGLFPMVVHDHGGGGAAGADSQRVAQIPLHEAMASHGLVTAVALHSANPVARVRDLTLVIDVLLARNAARGDPLVGSIDPDRIGISGISAGGTAAIGAARGIDAPALLRTHESGRWSSMSQDRSIRSMTPVGSRSRIWSWVGAVALWSGDSRLFAATVPAKPRSRS